MNKKILLSIVTILCLVTVLVGCNVPAVKSYSIPMIDLDQGIIRTGGLYDHAVLDEKGEPKKDKDGNEIKNDIAYTFTTELTDKMFAHKTIVADKDDFGKDYMAHPDSILLKRQKNGDNAYKYGNEILTVFPLGHGKGEIKAKISYDGGYTYKREDTLQNTPSSWAYSQETPTIYRLIFNESNVSDKDDLLILTSGNPRWAAEPQYHPNGFNVSISAPSRDLATGDMVEGREWSQFETWFGRGDDTIKDAINRSPKGPIKAIDAVVCMSSLTRLKTTNAQGKKVWADKWMGLFHDNQFNLYKSILSFEKFDAVKHAGLPTYIVKGEPCVMQWSDPVSEDKNDPIYKEYGKGMYFDEYRKTELQAMTCEVECIRSKAGNGDTLALLMRSNGRKMGATFNKNMYSIITTSTDEGKTWSAPRELPQAVSGERHKAEWIKDPKGNDKLFITFRSIERSDDKVGKFAASANWMSEGYVAWVGSWDDLMKGNEGDFRVKLAHTYLDGQTKPSRNANGDTGYCGNAVYTDPATGNMMIATCSYGRFSPSDDVFRGGHTYIAGRVLDVNALYKLATKAKPAPKPAPKPAA